jgi:hypothetical protein
VLSGLWLHMMGDSLCTVRWLTALPHDNFFHSDNITISPYLATPQILVVMGDLSISCLLPSNVVMSPSHDEQY